MERRRPSNGFKKVASGLIEKERERKAYSPYARKPQEQKKAHNVSRQANQNRDLPKEPKSSNIRPPVQKNCLLDGQKDGKKDLPEKRSISTDKKRALYKPEPESKGSSSAWDMNIKIGDQPTDDFIAFQAGDNEYSFHVAEEETEIFSTPWFDPKSYPLGINPTDRLQREVDSFIKYLSPTPAEITVREWLCKTVEKVTRQLYPSARVEIFGSFSTRLFLPTSDVDLVVFISDTDENTVSILKKLAKKIRTVMKPLHLEVRSSAKVPIINFRDSKTELEVDISINVESGLESRAIIINFLDECPAIRPLILLLKHFLELKELNKVFDGGLGSYAITLLVISFLQIHPKVRSGKIDPAKNIGVLLVEFFELYGPTFCFDNVGITLTNGGRYYKKIQKGSGNQRISPLELLDPQDETNNVARNSYAFHNVQIAFKGAFTVLTQNLLSYNVHLERSKKIRYNESILGSIMNFPQSSIDRRLKHERIFNKLC